MVSQSPFFSPGDVLHVKIKSETDCWIWTSAVEGTVVKTTHLWPENTLMGEGHELVGVCKGINQMLMERGIEYDSSGCSRARLNFYSCR